MKCLWEMVALSQSGDINTTVRDGGILQQILHTTAYPFLVGNGSFIEREFKNRSSRFLGEGVRFVSFEYQVHGNKKQNLFGRCGDFIRLIQQVNGRGTVKVYTG